MIEILYNGSMRHYCKRFEIVPTGFDVVMGVYYG
jgi:hypothetical protein